MSPLCFSKLHPSPFLLYFYLNMSTSTTRRPRSNIESFCTSNGQDDDGQWRTEVFTKWMWITMRPSTRGAHKVSRRHIGDRSHHWKGRILELKYGAEGKMVKVQHVYKASQLKLQEEEQQRCPANCKSHWWSN